MRIGLISTAYGMPTPPDTYGGMERINYWIGQELVKRGHDVVLFGGKGSYLEGAEIVELPGGGEVVPNEGGDYPPFFDFMKDWITSHDTIDIFHDSSHHHEFSRRLAAICSVSTIHNPNTPESHNSIFISDFHRNFLGHPTSPFVMNGCPKDEYFVGYNKDNYLLFMGALGKHKGFDRVVRAAVDYQIPLKIAGHPASAEEAEILEKAVTYPWIEYLGIIGGEFKNEVLAKAAAVAMPFRWPEPGCILAVEAMAAGTPIIASDAGVLPEYVVDRQTGFLGCGQPEDILKAYQSIELIRPSDCYQRYLEHFTIERVLDEYLVLYDRAVRGERW